MTDFPDLPKWAAALQARDNALLMIAVVAGSIAWWLFLIRFIPGLTRFLPAYRALMVVAYVVSLVLILVGVIK